MAPPPGAVQLPPGVVPTNVSPAQLAAKSLPVPRPTPFVGRDDALARLLGPLERESVGRTLIYGPPGVGKTALAVEVALRRAPDIRHLWWINVRGRRPGLGPTDVPRMANRTCLSAVPSTNATRARTRRPSAASSAGLRSCTPARCRARPAVGWQTALTPCNCSALAANLPPARIGIQKQRLEATNLEQLFRLLAGGNRENSWLLVIDDVKDTAAVQSLWERLPRQVGHVVVTSSKTPDDWKAVGVSFSQTIELEPWTAEDVATYLAQAAAANPDAANQLDAATVTALIGRVGRLPLTWRVVAGAAACLTAEQVRRRRGTPLGRATEG